MNYQTKGILAVVASSLATSLLVAWLVPEKVKGALAGGGIGAVSMIGAIAINRQQEDRLQKVIRSNISSIKHDKRFTELSAQYNTIANSVQSLSAQTKKIALESSKHDQRFTELSAQYDTIVSSVQSLPAQIEKNVLDSSAVSAIQKELAILKQSLEAPPTAVSEATDSASEARTHMLERIVMDGNDENSDEEEEGREVATTTAWFQSRNVELQSSYQPEPAIDELLDDLAVFLGDNYEILERFYKKLKFSLGKRCSFPLQDKSQKEISIHNLFFKKLKDSSLLSKGFYNKSDKIIIATTQNQEDVKFFLEGGWFERFVYYKIVDFLDSIGADYQVLRNLDITYENEDHFELDIFFMIQGQPLLVECKAGKQFDSGIATFTKHKQRLSLQPENAVFVALELEERLTAVRTKRMGVTVANKDTLLSHLDQLLTSMGIGQDAEVVASTKAALEDSSRSMETSAAVVDADTPDAANTVDLKRVFSKKKINLAPEYRKVVISELIQIFQEPDVALNFTQLIREIKDKLTNTPNELSRNKLTEILDTLRRSHCFLTKSKRTVRNVGKPIERLTSTNIDTLEQRCLRYYMKEVSKEVGPNFFDDPANVAQFNQLTHGEISLQS
ncbi:DUF1887 family protein [Leptolyngbya cf. ectocarpi LEGE 11479]|uniref:DUF1887 family protein n=1 Tax=Leptolyngbya cf. ectocarpi LEGE 11479 TaxID=1828722 RepID=A0A928ZWR3_LEPEC|nr:DUF1887 family CARF protein [Leptolyngbya ectocarpi]MBE9068912.1 DUF1887 family protein [Leptolyngbya cf. ectocarpi LEGE 11479]